MSYNTLRTRSGQGWYNVPLLFHWGPWKCSTAEFVRGGGKIAVEERPLDRAIRILLDHEKLNIRGWANLDHRLIEELEHESFGRMGGMPVPVSVGLEFLSPTLNVPVFDEKATFVMETWDPYPRDFNDEMNLVELGQCGLFAKLKADQILVDEKDESVSDLLSRILEKQLPNQQEIIRSRTRDIIKPTAEIITLTSVA